MIFNLITKAKELLYKNGKNVEEALDEVNEKLNTVEEISITKVTNGYAEMNDGSTCNVKNGVCYLTVIAQGKGTYSGWAHIGTLPVKPAINSNEYTACVDYVNDKNSILRIASDGKIYIIPNGTNTSSYYASISFPCVN